MHDVGLQWGYVKFPIRSHCDVIRAWRRIASTSWRDVPKLPDMKTSIPPVLITFSLVCLALVQNAQAVNPPPDGGYPEGNTAEGQAALLSLTTGFYNTAVGIYSVLSLTDGNFCTGVGAGSLLLNTADENTATGAGALLSNIGGSSNTATGAFSLFNNVGLAAPSKPTGVFVGSFNTANGR